MRLPTPLPAVLLAAALLSGCTSGGSSDDDEPAAFAPPPAGVLEAGPCSLVAEDLVDLGRLTVELRGQASPDQESKDLLQSAQGRTAAVAETADQSVKGALDTLVVRVAAVRIQVDTGRLEDSTLEAAHEAYEEAVTACSTPADASPAATAPADATPAASTGTAPTPPSG